MQLKRIINAIRHMPIMQYSAYVTPPPMPGNALLQETGSPLLLETGGAILLEASQ